MRRRGSTWAVGLAVGLGLASGPATAAFPGSNGRVVFNSSRDGDTEILTMRANGTGVRQLTESDGLDGDPAFSPDGATIAFWSDRLGDFEIFRMRASGADVTQLTRNRVLDNNPDWQRLHASTLI